MRKPTTLSKQSIANLKLAIETYGKDGRYYTCGFYKRAGIAGHMIVTVMDYENNILAEVSHLGEIEKYE